MSELQSYRVQSTYTTNRSGLTVAQGIQPAIHFSAPPEFLGQSGMWTPEHLLAASVAGCFISTFSAMADLSKMQFASLDLDAEAVLSKGEKGWNFTRIFVRPRLRIVHEEDRERALRLLGKVERNCFVARALAIPMETSPEVTLAEEQPEIQKIGESVAIS
ncbi:MAG: OsmC family protein [Acidobacteriia bacterium]|nr:OsmC family protein [Terriglobia bacterium]